MNHKTCLQEMRKILNLYQDIEDVLSTEALDTKELIRQVEKVQKLNAQIGAICSKFLPG